MKLEIEIKDKFNKIHIIKYELYNTDLTRRWVTFTQFNLKNPYYKINGVLNNRTELDLPEIAEKMQGVIDQINEEYDKKIKNFSETDLNSLHEEFEMFGERHSSTGVISKTLTDNFFMLNEYIHMYEDAINTKPNTWGRFGILYDIYPQGVFLKIREEDKLMLEPELKWGKLYLGYNTLGKDWLAVCKDNDIDVIARDMVKPQRRFSAETWLCFGKDGHRHYTVNNFLKWVKNLPHDLQKKVPIDNLNELTLGKFQIGELIIDEQFLNFDSNFLHWKVDNHDCKLRWNHEVLTTFRSIEKIRII